MAKRDAPQRGVDDDSEAERQIRLSSRLAAIEAHLVEIDRRQAEMEGRLASLGVPGEAAVIDLASSQRARRERVQELRQLAD